ncbi:hypothetical protein R5R35_011927 [Gryllus longicercus]|uniref:Translation initiation factor eIF2B subunit gamma n=1 Tax=Gryllus longicercus TaxID=2509291 RepID=A0AAN9VWC1_9ORTH
MVTAELQAIVMAGGKGSRMTEITVGRPKCLLPVGNQPMIWFPLQMLERAGIQDVIVVVTESIRVEVQTALDRSGLKMHIEIVAIPAGEDWGTADSLRHLGEKIKTDVLIVSCDLVTDVCLNEVVNVFRKHQASVTAVFFRTHNETNATTPGPKTKHKPERDLVGIDAVTSRLVFLASASDFEETLSLPRSLLRKHQHLTIHSQLVDSHLYVLRHWIVQYLIQEKSFTTLKGELLPYIVKKQLSKNVKSMETEPNASIIGVDVKKEVAQFAAGDQLDTDICNMSTFNDHHGDMKSAYHGDSIRCYAYIAGNDTFGMRANTLPVYCSLNRKVKNLWPLLTGGRELVRISSSSEIKSRQMDEDCLVGDHTVVSEKTSIKGTSIGSHCVIEPKVCLTNCIIMNGVKIREGCKLSNCVVCDEAEICSGCELIDCIVGSTHTVGEGEKHSNEVLTELDRLMEI